MPLFSREMQAVLKDSLDSVDLVRAAGETGKEIRFRLIPYRAVGVRSGLLAAFSPDMLKLDGKEVTDPLVAISPGPVSDGGAYSALAGADQ